jgi:predicted RND superfamily exporter protein
LTLCSLSFLCQSLTEAGFDGYVRKPCLHPHSPECPSTASNKNSSVEDIDEEGIQDALSKGCSGFASAASKWPLPVIVSGDQWKTGGGSPAIQAIFRLHSEQGVLKMLQEEARIPGNTLSKTNFSRGDASKLLEEWRKEFLNVVYDTETNRTYTQAHAWTTDSAESIIKRYSSGSALLLILGYTFMMVYSGVAFINIKSGIKSKANVGVVGVLLVMISCLAGLGFSSLCGLPFNPTTTQVLPFLVLGLGVDDMFVMAHTFFSIFNQAKYRRLPLHEVSRECLQRVGHSVTLTSLTNSAGFFLAAIIPIPAMRHFALQVGICVVVNYLVILLAFLAYLCIDGHRIRSGLYDGCCCNERMLSYLCSCVNSRESHATGNHNQIPNGIPTITDTSLSQISGIPVLETIQDREPSRQSSDRSCNKSQSWGDLFVQRIYTPILLHPAVKVCVLLITAGVLGICIYGAMKIENGLDLTEVVPSGSREHDYVSATLNYFSFFDLYIVQDYRNDFSSLAVQQEMLNFHQEFTKVKWILSGERTVNNKRVYTVSEPFWLEKMIDFYVTLQEQYEKEVATGSKSLTYVLVHAYLLPQIGNGSRSEDLVDLPGRKLFDNSTGRPLIPEDRFYVYLTAWVNTDILFAEATQPNFRPIVPFWPVAQHPAIEKAKKLTFAQMPMFANGLSSSASHIELIKQTRKIIENARSKGISAYPRGTSFTFYEQYINLQTYLIIAVVQILAACLLATSVLLLCVWSGVIMVFMLALTATEVYGFLGLADIQFSAIPCVTVIISVGATVEFTAPLLLMFVKITGTRKERVEYALLYRFIPIFNGAVTTLLGFVMLAFSEFEFIFKYFFLIFIALIVAGTFNGLVLLPVILSLIGPRPQVVPVDQLQLQETDTHQMTNIGTGSESNQPNHTSFHDLEVIRNGTPV